MRRSRSRSNASARSSVARAADSLGGAAPPPPQRLRLADAARSRSRARVAFSRRSSRRRACAFDDGCFFPTPPRGASAVAPRLVLFPPSPRRRRFLLGSLSCRQIRAQCLYRRFLLGERARRVPAPSRYASSSAFSSCTRASRRRADDAAVAAADARASTDSSPVRVSAATRSVSLGSRGASRVKSAFARCSGSSRRRRNGERSLASSSSFSSVSRGSSATTSNDVVSRDSSYDFLVV